MRNATKGKIIRHASTALCVGVPFAATLSQFPVWIEKSSEATVSGTFLVFAFLSALPFIKQIIAYFKSPAVWAVWVALLVCLVMLRNIIDEMIFVCLFGAPANILGMFTYKLGAHIEAKEDAVKPDEGEEEVSEE